MILIRIEIRTIRKIVFIKKNYYYYSRELLMSDNTLLSINKTAIFRDDFCNYLPIKSLLSFCILYFTCSLEVSSSVVVAAP